LQNIILGRFVATAKKVIVWFGIFLLFCATVLSVAGSLLFLNVWTTLVSIAIVIFDVYAFYARFIRKKKRYPLIPPEGKPDWYLPLTNIPRPVIEDSRKEEEKKRKLARVRKMVFRAMKPTKKHA
jgi:hypothetical protein